MVKHITVRWDDAAASSHAYGQVIPHLTLRPPHLYAATRQPTLDGAQHAHSDTTRQHSVRSTKRQKQPAVVAPLASSPATEMAVVDAEAESAMSAVEDKQSSPASPTCAVPSFPLSPNRARLTTAQASIHAIDAQLAQLRAEAEAEAGSRSSARRQQRAVSAGLTRRDVLHFRHAGCTGNVHLNAQVNQLMGARHSQLTQLYQPVHRQPPPIPVPQHERPGTVDSRNAQVSTAPFAFGASQPRFGQEEQAADDEQGADTAEDRAEGRQDREAEERQVKWADGERSASGGRSKQTQPAAPSAASRRPVLAKRAATDKSATRSVRASRDAVAVLSSTAKRSGTATNSESGRDGREEKQSSPPPQPNPPPPAPTPQLRHTQHTAEPQPTTSRPQPLPPRPGWLSWRVGPGTNNNQPAAHVVNDSQALLTIGRAEWREVEVGGEQRGKARVRQRRVEDERQWNERISRERRGRELLASQSLLSANSGRVHEYDLAIAREKALEDEARRQLVREEQRLEALRAARRAQPAEFDTATAGRRQATAEESWASHPFVHPSFPPPPISGLTSPTRPALPQAASHWQHTRFTSAPDIAPQSAVVPRPHIGRLSAASAQSTKQPAKRGVNASSVRAKRAASQKTAGRADTRSKHPTSETANAHARLPLSPLPSELDGGAQRQQPLPHFQLPDESSMQRPVADGEVGCLDAAAEAEWRLQRHIEQYEQQLRQDGGMVERDEQYVRSMGSKDVRRQRMINNIARARRDIREKQARLAQLRQQLSETRQHRHEAAATQPATRPASSLSAYRTPRAGGVTLARRVVAGSASVAVQVPDVFVALRDTSDHSADDERLRLQRSIESDMADIVRILQSRVGHTDIAAGTRDTKRSQRWQAEAARVEVEDVTAEEKSAAESVERERQHSPLELHEHEHHYVDEAATPPTTSSAFAFSLSSRSSEREVSSSPRAVDGEAMHARALRLIEQRQAEVRSKLSASGATACSDDTSAVHG